MENIIHGGETGPIDSLDHALAAVRRRVSSILHDDVGPSLCAAGLHLELLSRAATTEDSREAAAGLRAALDQALERLRALMLENDARLFVRNGLDDALTALARALPLAWEPPKGLPAPPAAEFYYRVARECAVLCAASDPPVRPVVRRTAAGMSIALPAATAGEMIAPWLPAWRFLAARAQVRLTVEAAVPGVELKLAPDPPAAQP